MSKITLDVADLFSVLDFAGVQKRLLALQGVSAVEMTAASSSVTVTYDPARTDIAAIAGKIKACGFHCRGETVPNHLCLPDSAVVPSGSPKAPPAAVPAKGPQAGHTGMTPAAMEEMDESPADKKSGMAKDAMAHEMGHGSGMDMQAMVTDMRNRFIICLVFTLPIFALAPMGMGAPLFGPPFGLSLDVTLFLLASAAILYPVWPFVVAAFRSLRNGVLNMAVLVVLSVGTGYGFSVGATFFFEGTQFYEAASVLLVFILLGHWLEMRARAGASAAILMQAKVRDAIRAVEYNLLGESMISVYALVSPEFFDKLIGHALTQDAYKFYSAMRAQPLRQDVRRSFPFAGILFEEYRGTVTLSTGVAERLISAGEGIAVRVVRKSPDEITPFRRWAHPVRNHPVGCAHRRYAHAHTRRPGQDRAGGLHPSG